MGKSTSQLTPAEYQALIVGIPKYMPGAIFMVASQTFTATQAVAFLQTLHDSSAARVAARAALTQAIHADQALEAQNGPVAREMRDAVALAFSNAPTTLAAFSLTMRKTPTPLSTQARAAANAKAKATREARGTKGKVQKAAITGNVTGVTITPITAPTAPAATAAPSPATPAASNGATPATHT
jgi:hypothetical protein